MDSSHSQEASADDAVVYVEELANADDYWLSITDASRVCRVQDVSIRRAINRKSLPVRRQRAGQNKRTRFVRASDLASAGFPIIDESAMITTEIGKVDVLSIPRQQQQIVQDHQALMLSLGEMQERLANSQRQMQEDLYQQQERFQAALLSAQTEQAHQLSVTKTTLTQEQELLQRSLTEGAQHFTSVYQTLRRDLTQEQTDAHTRNERTQVVITNLQQDLTEEQANTLSRDEHLQSIMNILQTAFHERQTEVQRQLTHLLTTQQDHQRSIDITIKRIEQETWERFNAIEQRVTDGLKQLEQTFDRQLNSLEETLAQVQQSSEGFRRSTMEREHEHDLVVRQMQTQMNQYDQLLPLLPYAQQRLVSEQDIAAWSLTFANQQRELERHQQLLALLSSERLEILARLLTNEEALGEQDDAQWVL